MTARLPVLNSLRARLLLGLGVPLVLFVAVAAAALDTVARLVDALGLENRSHEVILEGTRQQAALQRMDLIVEYGQVVDPTFLKSGYDATRQTFLEANARALDLLDEDGAQADLLRVVRRREEDWHRFVAAQFWVKPDGPRPRGGPGFPVQSHVLAEHTQEALSRFIAGEKERLTARHARAEKLSWQSSWAMGIALVVVVLFSVAVAWRVSLSVTRPVDRLREATRRLLAGSFTMERPEGPDEIAQLTTDFNHMGLSLTERAHSLEVQGEGYRQYLGATTHLMWRTDPEGRPGDDLPAWRAFTGQTPDEVSGLGWLDAVHPDEREAVRGRWLECVRDRAPYEVEYRLRSASGAYRTFLARAVPVTGADGAVREWIGTCIDVTERNENARLAREKEAAEARSRAKTEFLTRMSHELRTPLNAIIGMSRMLATQRFGSLTAKQADYLADIVGAGEHLLALINDLLDLTRVEAGRLELRPEGFPVTAAVASVLSTLRPLAAPKGLTLRFDPAVPDGEIATDPGRFKQVLYNFLSNAIKFTPRGSVTIRCQWVEAARRDARPVPEAEAAALRVEVADTGIGIAPEHLAAVWEEFRQVPGVAQKVGLQPGTGLGLALARQLVQHMGGAIWVESAPDVGSTFGFVLPRRPPAPSAAADGDSAAADRPLALVIEDYPPTHKLLVDWLHEAGLATASAFDGETGLTQARQLHPRLIVLDLQLPRLDGWQVVTALKEDPATAAIPVVIVTVNEEPARPGEAGVGTLRHVHEFFVKPLERDDFFRRLRLAQPSLFIAGGSPKALVVEDDPAVRKMTGDLLRAQGVHVTEAADGRAALAALEADRPDLVVLDLMLPEMDGFGVVEAVRARPDWGQLPILVVTAKDLTEGERRRLKGRIQALLAKEKLTPEKFCQQLADLGLLGGAARNGVF
jgi:PAS domain S-box-containing protein